MSTHVDFWPPLVLGEPSYNGYGRGEHKTQSHSVKVVEKTFLGSTESRIIFFLPEVPDLKETTIPAWVVCGGRVYWGEMLQNKHILTFRVRKTISGVK